MEAALKDNAQVRTGARPGYAEVDPQTARRALLAFADVVVVLDRQGFVLSTAGAQAPALAAAVGLVDGAEFRDTLARESWARAEEILGQAAGADATRGRELNHRTRDGGHIPITYRAFAQGDTGDTLLVGRDMSEVAAIQQRLLQAQQATERDYARIRSMETRYRVLFQLSQEPILVCDAATRKVVEANGACLAAFNLPLGRLIGRSLASIFDEHDGELLAGLVSNAMSGGEARPATLRAAAGETQFRTTIHMFRQDGASHLLVRPTPLATAHHPAANDATFLHAMIERLPDAFVVTDADGRIVQANRKFLDLAELPSPGACEGRGLGEWLGRPGVDFAVLLSTVRDAGAVRGFDSVLRGAYGASEQVDVAAVSVFDHAEPRLGFLIRAISERVASGSPQPALPRSIEQMKQLVGSVPLKELVRETSDMIERLCIMAALELTSDNRAAAADMLGLSRQSLYAKLNRYGIGDADGASPASIYPDET